MTDLARLPSAADSATFVEAYRKWMREADDEVLAEAMFRLFPENDGPRDRRCVTIDGYAFAAKRDRYEDDSVEYELEHFTLNAHVTVTKPR